jgi:hypothetical protein
MSNWFSDNIWSSDKKKSDDKIEPPEFSSKASSKTVQPPSFSSAPQAAQQQTTYVATPVVTDAEIQKYREHIKEVMRGANQQGPDYFEFSEALERNASMNLDRGVAFVVAYNSLISLGLSKQKLVETAQYYITKLQEDLNGFKADREERRQRDVLGKENDIKNLHNENEQIRLEIEKLSQKMSDNNQRISQLEVEKTTAEQKITTSTSNMEKAINDEIARINNDIATINQVIK